MKASIATRAFADELCPAERFAFIVGYTVGQTGTMPSPAVLEGLRLSLRADDQGETTVADADGPAAPQSWSPDPKSWGGRILAELAAGPAEHSGGSATAVLVARLGFSAAQTYLCKELRRLEDARLVERSVKGRRCYRIALRTP